MDTKFLLRQKLVNDIVRQQCLLWNKYILYFPWVKLFFTVLSKKSHWNIICIHKIERYKIKIKETKLLLNIGERGGKTYISQWERARFSYLEFRPLQVLIPISVYACRSVPRWEGNFLHYDFAGSFRLSHCQLHTCMYPHIYILEGTITSLVLQVRWLDQETLISNLS